VDAEGGVTWCGVFQEGDPAPLALFRYAHDAAEWAEWHAGDVRRVTSYARDLLAEGDGLDPYRAT